MSTQQRTGRRWWLWWLIGGVTFFFVMAAVGGVWGIVSLVHGFQNGAFSCLPSDFPRYPGSTVSAETTTTAGNRRECRMSFESGDAVTTVGPYYEAKLKSGDWTLISVDYTSGTIKFSRVSTLNVFGSVELFKVGTGTRIAIVLDG
ncbi:MAG TPA: hypothetical protein VLK30_00105 [Candidatus Limnocylindrales bacterium]|nr:hypothetical protein [Candidatus Limnocylindrales bacterium]